MLSVHAEHVLGVKVKGTTDVAVCSRALVASTSLQLGLLLLTKLKKGESSDATVQAQATLLMANFLSPASRPILVSLRFCKSISRSKNIRIGLLSCSHLFTGSRVSSFPSFQKEADQLLLKLVHLCHPQ